MNDPAFLFYSSDFLTGVADLTMEERGQFITLLCLQHQKGHLNDKIIRLCVGSVSEDVIKKFINDEQGLFYNKRLDLEIDKRENFVESRRENGKLGGRPKKPSGYPNGEAKNNLLEDDNDNEIINRIKDEFNLIGLSKVTVLSKSRKEKLKLRLKEFGEEKIISAIQKIPKSKFLMGDNKNGWKCTFDWLIENDKNILKVYEGNYDGNEKTVEDKVNNAKEMMKYR